MAGVADEHRRWIAGTLLAVGVCLILAGVVLTIKHQHQFASFRTPATQAVTRSTMEDAVLLQRILFWVLILIGLFGVGSLAFLRWSRRFRKLLLRSPRQATPTDDVWAMHKVPDEKSPLDRQQGEENPPQDSD